MFPTPKVEALLTSVDARVADSLIVAKKSVQYQRENQNFVVFIEIRSRYVPSVP